MPNVARNFVAGKMNKVVDQRLVPNGEYIDAMNVRMGSTENSEIGVIENTKGNEALTSLMFNGVGLSADAVCIGALENGQKETVYWLVHDPNYPSSPTGKIDMIVSFNVATGVLSYHIISTQEIGTANTTLNFNPNYLVTGINLIDNLLFFTDDYNPPRFINIAKSYPNPIAGVDQFTAESILVIKKPPYAAPSIFPYTTNGQENFMETRFLCFAYRYRYENNEYSATSQWSEPAFYPQAFDFSINSFLNEGMVNLANAVQITYNSGGPLVKGIDLLFKEADKNIIKVIEKLDKAELGIPDNTDRTYQFTNNKIFTILSESELLRLYDNVPLLAKAQTIMGNRLMYGNYVEGYDLIDRYGSPVKFEYFTDLISNFIGLDNIATVTSAGSYTIDGPQTIPDATVEIDLTNVAGELNEGSGITLDVTLNHNSFSGAAPIPTEITVDVKVTFTFTLPTSYASVYELATSVAFQDAIGTVLNIQTVYPNNSCSGITFTDQVNCALPMNLDAYTKYASGISAGGQPIAIITSPGSNVIGLKFPAMRYVDNVTTPVYNLYEYYKITYSEASFQKVAHAKSLHSNRDYEIGIVYMDEYKRATTALVSPNNTVHVPCGDANKQNTIQVTIPVTQVAPEWATSYKFVIKPSETYYETIYNNIFFQDPETNNAYFLLEGENAKKVEQGDRLIVKADTDGPTQTCVYATVLEKAAQQSGFLKIPSSLDPTVDIPVPAGVYMKINPSNFAAVQDELSIIAPGTIQVNEDTRDEYVLAEYQMNRYDTATNQWVDYTVPAGSKIKLYIKFQRLGVGAGNGACEKRIYTLEKNLVSSSDYNNMQDWWNGDNIDLVITDGVAEVGGSGCPINNYYLDTLASSPTDIPSNLCTNYYRFYRYPTVSGDPNSNKLVLLLRGTQRCPGVLAGERRRSSVIANIEVFRTEKTLIFETEPTEALPDVFYENELCFAIDTLTGEHQGNVQNQDFATLQPAIIDTGFFNCFAFGNGAESYKIRDSIVGKSFSLGNRVTSVAAQNYAEVDRFADISYSGVYNLETNVNKLNEFNLGLLDYKNLEISFGPILKMDARETDVLVLQEDKISYVLAGKNLLSDSTGGGVVSSVPEVLGTQIARVEKYGISFNPESYVHWGYDRYFTDAKRGVVLQLKGDSYNTDQLQVVSEFGMRTWFRDLFNASFNTQKLGGYDPYLNEYVLSSNDKQIPTPPQCVECGFTQTFTFSADIGGTFDYCVAVGPLVGEVVVNYNVVGVADDFVIDAEYDNIVVSSGTTQSSGTLSVNKNLITDEVVNISINATGALILEVTVDCPLVEELILVQVVVTSPNDAGDTIHVEYRYSDGGYVSPLQSTFVSFASGITNPLVSLYNGVIGAVGSGSFPVAGSTVRIQTNKIFPDNYDFDYPNDKFKYLRSNTLYPNTTVGIQNLLNDSILATPVTTGAVVNYADFVMPSTGDYLYLIWDLRHSVPLELCYSTISTLDACCNCSPCEGCVTYSISIPRGGESAQVRYYDCLTSEPIEITVLPETTINVCTAGAPPDAMSGSPVIEFVQCGCPT